MGWKVWSLVVGVIVLFAMTSNAQVTTGTISGTVSDSSGAAIPGAKVVILNQDTGVTRTVATDAAGRYAAPSLSLGSYRVTVSQPGFETETRSGIVLTVARSAVVNIKLNVGAVTQTVTVSGEAPLIQTKDSTVGYLVGDRSVRELPLNGRDISELILLNPGVTQSENAGHNSAYAGWGKKISISGLRPSDNAYLLDGAYINDMNRFIPAGPGGALLGAETVREFQVLTNSYSAQYGRSLGGVFNAVSKSGTNAWHGDAFEFLRNDKIDAAKWEDNAFGTQKPAFKRNQFGGTLGGPIVKDKTFIFLAYEGMRERQNQTQVNNVPDMNARLGILPGGKTVQVNPFIAGYLTYFPEPTPGGTNFGDGTAQYIFNADQPAQDDFGQIRLDQQFSQNDSFFARGVVSNANQSTVSNYPDFRKIFVMNTRLLTLAETHIFSPTMLNTVHASLNRIDPQDRSKFPTIAADLISVPGPLPPGLIPGSGITTWEGAPKPLDRWVTNRYNFKDDVNMTRGAHSITFGGMVERLQFNMITPNRPFGEWTFADLQDFLRGIPSQYRGTPPQTGSDYRGMRQWFFALYLQDNWQVRPRLTLNLGVRWEPYTVPTEVHGLTANLRNLMDPASTIGDPLFENKSWGNIGPRFGFAWSPFEGGKTSVRGGFGLFYIPNGPQLYRSQPLRTTPFFAEFKFKHPDPALFPNALAVIAAETSGAGATQGSTEAFVYNNTKTSHALQYNLNVQQQIGASNVLTLGYSGSRGLDLTTYGNYNFPLGYFDGTSLAIQPGSTVFNPNFDAINYYANNADSWYNGLTVSFQRRFSHGLQAALSYTWSRSISTGDASQKVDRTGSGGGDVKYAHNLLADKGLSGMDLGQVLSINYSYDLPFGHNLSGVAGHVLSGWEFNGIISVQDGQPFTIFAKAPKAVNALSPGQTSPNLNPGFSYSDIIWGAPNVSKDPSGQQRYFNPAAYSAPGKYEFGNVGRNTLIGPGLAKWDFGLIKNTPLTERTHLQFRAEMFNFLNRPNFAIPVNNTTLFSGSGSPVGSAGVITSTITSARQIQFALKLIF